MPFVTVHGHRCRYRFDGPERAPVLILSNSLGTTLEMWDAQLPELGQCLRLLRYDTRGHGQSEVTPVGANGGYTAELLGQDVLALADALALPRFAFCGLSMGGLIGQWLGVHAGNRLSHLVLCNTAAKIGTAEGWNARISSVLGSGMAETASGAIGRWFTPEFAAAEPAQVEVVRQQLLSSPPAGYAANCAAVRDADFREQLGQIQAPVLFVAGTRDPVTTVADAEAVVAAIPDATLLPLEAAHLSNIGARADFDAALRRFLGV
jgi:3-oxoadipate enol-lactonase